VTLGRWIQGHKTTFLAVALLLMSASLASGVREKIVKGKNSGLIAFGVSVLAIASLLAYTKVTTGFFF